MKIFSTLRSVVTALGQPEEVGAEQYLHWLRDPLSHPALETMSERELGDLPFRRGPLLHSSGGAQNGG